MPSKPPSPCRHPGCPALVIGGGYCPAHASDRNAGRRAYDQYTRKQDPRLAEATRIRNSSQWQRVRAVHKAAFPLCCDPFGLHGGFPYPNEQSNHIEPLVDRPDLAFDLRNLGPVCTGCHALVSAMERKGKSTVHLFAAYQAQYDASQQDKPSSSHALG